jgi:methylated-DNA-[protein]-cysteine S-methyltransferase
MTYAHSAVQIATPIGPVRITAAGDLITGIAIGDQRSGENPSLVLNEARAQLLAYFDHRLTDFDLPLQPASTIRRDEIWRAMRAVGYGQTATYGEVAARTGSIARAVGQACRHNPFPIVIPCHRILRAGNKLGPYSAGEGPDTKRELLKHEKAEGWLI